MKQYTLKKDIEIRCELGDIKRKHPVLVFDKRRLQQIILNLLSNAIKFQKHGLILVTVEILPATLDLQGTKTIL